MAGKSSCFVLLLQILLFANYRVATTQPTQLDVDTVKAFFSFKRNFNISNIISEIGYTHSTENDDCSRDLSKIINGLENLDEWAFKIVDAWGTAPSGFFDGNRNSMGSFSECFYFKRNGYELKTQYCIAQLKLPSNENRNKVKNSWSIFQDNATVSIGICLPASCSVHHLESEMNEVVKRQISADMQVIIPKLFCQIEEDDTQLQTFDLFVIGLLSILLILVLASTCYDILYTLTSQNRNPLFVIFSIFTNGVKLFSRESKADTNVIECIRGIRVLSTSWIVYIHVNSIYMFLPIYQSTSFFEFQDTYRGKVLFSPNAVDVFLTLSGLLAARKMFNLFKGKGKLSIFSLYLDRYLRLTPLLFFYVLVGMSLTRFLESGPFWPISIHHLGHCWSYWWSVLIHAQNYVNPNELCFDVSWYISVDIQLFIIAPAIVYCIHRSKTKTFIALFALVVIGAGCILAAHAKHNLRNLSEARFFELSHLPTHLRFIPWLIGFVTGYLLSEFPTGSIRIPKKLNIFGLVLSLGMLAASVIAGYSVFETYPKHTSLMLGRYFAISRITQSVALCYMIFACVHNAGGPVNWFLSHPHWELPSKLSYSIYMTHYLILLVAMFSMKKPVYFSEISAFLLFIGVFVLASLVSIVATLTFEMPIRNVYKTFAKSNHGSNALNFDLNKQNSLNCEKSENKTK